MTYIDNDPVTKEVHVNKYNISYIRYYTPRDAALDGIGTLLGFLLWASSDVIFQFTLSIQFSILYLLYALGGSIWLFSSALVCIHAGEQPRSGIRMAARRGLYTVTVLFVTTILLLALFQFLSWEMTFGVFLKKLMMSMMISSCFSVLLSYGIGYLLSRGQQRNQRKHVAQDKNKKINKKN